MKKSNRVEVQKGGINPDIDTQKTITPEKRAMEDYEYQKLKRSGQTLKLHTPKK